jgi:quercetin dioxygenase-like cupin family protein
MRNVLVPDVHVSARELERRTIRRSNWVSCNAAFIDCRTPGSDRKENYAFIGSGVSQNADQFVNLTELHGYNVGAAGMPNGVTNNLHLHFTAEVFINFGGTFRLRWGVGGEQGEYVSHDGDVITVPTWIFRGFTNEGADDGILLTVLGQDVTGGIIWGPSVLEQAESYGLYLTADSRLIDTVAGDQVPTDVPLIKPMKQRYIDELTTYTVEEMRRRVIQPGDRVYSKRSFLCTDLPGGNAELALGIGYGMSEDRRQVPNVHEPHSFNLAWLRAVPGEGMLRHRHDQTQVLTVKSGVWDVTLNEEEDEQTVRLGVQDALSVPAGSWRTIKLAEAGDDAATDGTGELLVVNGGDGRVKLEWSPEVIDAAFEAGWMLDPNGYVSPVAVMVAATIDD